MEAGDTAKHKEFGALLLDVGVSLLNSGASCSRIRVNVARFAKAYGYAPHITIGPKSVTVTLNDENGITLFSGNRSTPSQGVDFRLMSEISRLSWAATKEQLNVVELKNRLNAIRHQKSYPRFIVLCFVSLASAAFCYTFGGNYLEMLITATACFCGLFVKQQLTKYAVNPYVCTLVAAFMASLFTGAFHAAGLNITLENAFSTCVLFLIPGVPLINSFTDMIDGNILNGMVRGVNAFLHAMAIALGLATTMIIYNIAG